MIVTEAELDALISKKITDSRLLKKAFGSFIVSLNILSEANLDKPKYKRIEDYLKMMANDNDKRTVMQDILQEKDLKSAVKILLERVLKE